MVRLLASLVIVAAVLAAQPTAQNAQPTTAPRAEARPATLVNLNTATSAELEKLPGIGQKVAARIIEYRQKRGPFKRIEELMNVQGIGEKSFLQLRNQITVGVTPEVAARQR